MTRRNDDLLKVTKSKTLELFKSKINVLLGSLSYHSPKNRKKTFE